MPRNSAGEFEMARKSLERMFSPPGDRRTSDYWIAQATDEFGVDRQVAASAIGILFSGLSSLLSQMRARPGPERRQFLEDAYVQVTLGALGRLATHGPHASAESSRS